MLSEGFPRVLSSTTIQSTNSLVLSLPYGPTLTSVHDYWKNHSFDIQTFVSEVMSLLFNMLSRLVIAFFMVQLSKLYLTTGKIIVLTIQTFVSKVMSLLFNMLSGLVIAFLPRSKHLLISWLQSYPGQISQFQTLTSSCLWPHHMFPLTWSSLEHWGWGHSWVSCSEHGVTSGLTFSKRFHGIVATLVSLRPTGFQWPSLKWQALGPNQLPILNDEGDNYYV